MSKLIVQMYDNIIEIDPQSNRFACQGIDKDGIDRLGPATPEQKKEAKARRKAELKLTTKETVVTNLFFAVFFAAFIVGRMSLGSNPIEDTQTILQFFAGLMK